MNGRWETTPWQYADAARRYRDEIGGLQWAAPQDWMCEPMMLKKTGLTVAQHQERTTANFSRLVDLAPDVAWAPVLQGWSLADYLRHVEAYARAGVDLWAAPIVGVGTMCRRQGTDEAVQILGTLAGLGLRLHGFGLKTLGLRRTAGALASADSLAWSYDARRSAPLPGHTHKNCANCIDYATAWRARLLANLPAVQPLQLALDLMEAA